MSTASTDVQRIAARIRGQVVELSHRGAAPHVGSALSTIEILVALYWRVLRIDPAEPERADRDRFVLSKGHAAAALYATLAERGFFPGELLDTYTKPGGRLAEQPSPGCLPGIEAATGSLGHGLPIAVGMAYAARIAGQPHRVFALLSDGECNEGSVWEAAMMAPAQGLDNLVVLIDFNRWQATDRSSEVLALEPLREKWQSFGWSTHEVDGHDVNMLGDVMAGMSGGSGCPWVVIAHTVKGKGVSFMEDDNNWHYRIPTATEVHYAKVELGLVMA